MSWRPGESQRHLALEEPYEDVPAHLSGPLTAWFQTMLSSSFELTEHVVMTERMAAPDVRRNHGLVLTRVMQEARSSPARLLDLVEVLLASGRMPPSYASRLGELLDLANSAYAVRPDGLGLEMRVLPEARALVDSVVQEAADVGSVADHLAAAWNAAYSRNADPVRSYSEAIKAVEAAAAPVITPRNKKATLGTLIGELDANPDKWQAVLASTPHPTSAAVAMMKALWSGQTSRHGGVNPTIPETLEMAQAAVFLAVTLVQWFISGGVRPAS